MHTTAFVKPVVEHWLEREIAQWVHPMKDWSDDPSHHEQTLLPRSFVAQKRNASQLAVRVVTCADLSVCSDHGLQVNCM